MQNTSFRVEMVVVEPPKSSKELDRKLKVEIMKVG